MTTRHILYLIFLLLSIMWSIQPMFAQEGSLITKKIVDKKTGESLPDAYVIYDHKTRGAVPDMNGLVSVPISNTADLQDSIYITHLGYQTYVISLKDVMQRSTLELTPIPYSLPDLHVLATKDPNKDWSKIFQQAVKEYDMMRRKRPYMAIAQYAEEARHQGKPIMFMESLGYMIYMGQLAHAAPPSNMQFYADQSRSYVTNPLWQQYKINIPDTSTLFSQV